MECHFSNQKVRLMLGFMLKTVASREGEIGALLGDQIQI